MTLHPSRNQSLQDSRGDPPSAVTDSNAADTASAVRSVRRGGPYMGALPLCGLVVQAQAADGFLRWPRGAASAGVRRDRVSYSWRR